MRQKLILLLPLLLLFAAGAALAQSSGKSKSKDRLREKDDRQYPVDTKNVVPINSENPEVAPTYYENGLLFVSARSKKGPFDQNGNPFFQLFFSPFDPNGDPSPPTKFEFDAYLKSPLHEGPTCFTRDFKTAYVTRTNNKNGVRQAGRNGESKLKIYEMQYGQPDWMEPVDLPFNSDDYNCAHPSLSPDGTKMFFASDMPGGIGNFDLYVVDRNPDGTWGTPVNLGPKINTEKKEVYPFMSFSGALFFSSNGRDNSLGGLDLYFVNNPLNNPEEVVNLNVPFNTDKDEKSLIIDPDGKTGFFVSEGKRGKGKEDIFKFDAPNGLEGTGQPQSSVAKFIVTDAKTGDPLQNAEIRILQLSDEGMVSANKDFYSIELAPVQDKKNALSLQIVRKGADDLGKADLYSNFTGEARHEFNRFRQYLVFVSLDGYRTAERAISVESDGELVLRFNLSEAPPCLRAGGIVLTSEFGTRISNAVLKFIHKRTGEEITARTTLNGEFDACLPVEGEYIAYVERDGFKPANKEITVGRGKRAYSEVRLRPLVDNVTAEQSMPLANGVSEGSVIILDKIFYEYNKATLNQNAVRHLEALLELLNRYPEMEIDLAVHTDTRGDASMNQVLTDERAKNAKTYLTYRGIAPERINAFGKGETEPRNRCVDGIDDCSDEQHQQNNRLEVKIRKLGNSVKP